MPSGRIGAILVHLLTASGSVCGLLALHFAAQQNWPAAFIWLGVALIVDGVDGPLARAVDAPAILPRFSGATLDETVDFLNYCVVPAFILLQGGLLGPWFGPLAASLILLTSLFHFADRRSKTKDGYFVGFPAAWNLACFYIFVFGMTQTAALALIAVLAILIFIPLKWVHPLRVRRLRPVTLAVVLCWGVAAAFALSGGFPANAAVKAIFAGSALYVLALGLSRSFTSETEIRH